MAELQFFNLPQALGAGLDIRHAQQRSHLAELSSQMEQQKFQRATTAYERQQAQLAAMTPEQRMAFTFAPEQAGQALAKSMWRDPKDAYLAVPDVGLVDLTGTAPRVAIPSNGGLSFEGGGAPGANLQNAAPPAQAPAGQANGPPAPLNYASALQGRENTTGNPAAANRRSSAVGDHQFLAGTWLDMVKTHRAWLAEGKTDAEILEMRKDPALSAEMAESYAADNTPILQNAGFEPTPVNLAVLHGFGPAGGLRILEAERANPNTPLEAVLSPEALSANPEMRGMTIAQGRAQLEKQMGYRSGLPDPRAPQQAPQQAPPQQAPQQAPPSVPPGATAAAPDADGLRRILHKGSPYTTGAPEGHQWAVDRNGQWRVVPIRGAPEAGDLFPGIPKPYASKSPDAEAENIVAQYETLRRRGIQPNMQQEYAYRLATRRLMEQRTVATPDGGFATVNPAPLPTSQTTQDPATGQTVTQIVEPKPKPSATEVKALKDAEVQVAQVGAAIKAYRDALKDTGGPGLSSVMGLPTAAASRLNTAYNNLALLVKGDVLYQLGVLNGPDLDIIRRTLLDPSTLAAYAASPKALADQIGQIEHLISSGIKEKRRQFQTERAVPPQDETPPPGGGNLPPPPPGAVIVQ
jgi:hypothetical protein